MALPRATETSHATRSTRERRKSSRTKSRKHHEPPADSQDVLDVNELRRARVRYYSTNGIEPKPFAQESRTEHQQSEAAPSRRAKATTSKRRKVGLGGLTKRSSRRDDGADTEYVYRASVAAHKAQPTDDDGETKDYHAPHDTPDLGAQEDESEIEDRPFSTPPPPAPEPPRSAVPTSSEPLTVQRTKSSSQRKSSKERTPHRSKSKANTNTKSAIAANTAKPRRRFSEPPLPTVAERETPKIEKGIATGKNGKEKRKASLFGGLFASRGNLPPPPPRPSAAERECLTCAERKPSRQVAKLECGHKMCHACLKHVFTMSLTDPQHMPPRCCTAEPIDLKHVSNLFDDRFKRRWNKRHREYTTLNRLYCPARGCGAWIPPNCIRPSQIDAERRLGTCTRCKTRACAACGRRWHTSSDCDAGLKGTNARDFARMAQESGWQRCSNCKATIELKEGCNHMTCRCGAQFCMVCGATWKTCDCPWFNFATLAPEDQFMPGTARIVEPVRGGHAARGYAEEMAHRQEQERRDEEMARRMQGLEMGGIGAARRGSTTPTMERDWGGNDTYGFGNMAGHFLNDNFIQRAARILTGALTDENRLAADRLVAEIRAERAPPLPANAVISPVAQHWVSPAGQEHGVMAGEGEPPEAPSRSRRRRSVRRSYKDAPEFLDDTLVPTDTQKQRKRDQTSCNDEPPQRDSILAGLAPSPGQDRVEQWMQHVASDDKADSGVREQ